mgnify:CR=1 FL=1
MGTPRKYTIRQLAEAVKTSKNFVEVHKKIGLKGNNHASLKKIIEDAGIDASHVRWGNGNPLPEILVKNSDYTKTGHLKNRLLKEGMKESKCEKCGIIEWCEKPLSFHLHHINGDYRDNRLENLQILCPNCHSQTDNFGVKNSGKGRPR